MKIIFPLFLAFAFPVTSHAQHSPAGRLSGAQMIERWTSPAANGRDRDPAAILAREYADGYLAGVADAGEGKVWCNKHAVKPHEVDAEIMGVLKSLSASSTSRTVAARLLSEALASRFPCTGGSK